MCEDDEWEIEILNAEIKKSDLICTLQLLCLVKLRTSANMMLFQTKA